MAHSAPPNTSKNVIAEMTSGLTANSFLADALRRGVHGLFVWIGQAAFDEVVNDECHRQNPWRCTAEHRHRLKSYCKNPIAKTKPLKAHGLQASAQARKHASTQARKACNPALIWFNTKEKNRL
jgi:hypothetical protein